MCLQDRGGIVGTCCVCMCVVVLCKYVHIVVVVVVFHVDLFLSGYFTNKDFNRSFIYIFIYKLTE